MHVGLEDVKKDRSFVAWPVWQGHGHGYGQTGMGMAKARALPGHGHGHGYGQTGIGMPTPWAWAGHGHDDVDISTGQGIIRMPAMKFGPADLVQQIGSSRLDQHLVQRGTCWQQ